jgi:hypothetical protein
MLEFSKPCFTLNKTEVSFIVPIVPALFVPDPWSTVSDNLSINKLIFNLETSLFLILCTNINGSLSSLGQSPLGALAHFEKSLTCLVHF